MAASLLLHRGRFIKLSPASVAALAPTPDGGAVAVGREDGSLELYDVAADWHCVLRVPGCERASLTGLAWCSPGEGQPPRLLSSSLSGQLVTWDLQALRPLSSVDSGGGPVWHISAQPPGGPGEPQRVAVACDDGNLRLFGMGESGAEFRRSFTRVESRLLCTAWHPNRSTVVVGGSDGCVRCWDARTGEELLRLTLGRGSQLAPPCVWSVLVLPDGTLASGDSEGCTRLWDATHGALLHSFTAHSADVLALACTPSGDALFSAGVDSKVAVFGAVAGSGAALPVWNLLGYKRAHSHDVRALALAPFPSAQAEEGRPSPQHSASMLLSAGTDAQLIAYAAENFMGEHPVRVVRQPPFPPLSLAAATAPLQPLLLCTHPSWMDVWRLGAGAGEAADASPAALELAAAPQHLARIRVRCARHLLCGALSPSGLLAAASDAAATHLFCLQLAGKKKSVSKLALPSAAPPATQLAFTSDDARLALCSPQGEVLLLLLSTGETLCTFRAHLRSGPWEPALPGALQLPPVTHLCLSPDRQWLAVACAESYHGPFVGAATTSAVTVYSLEAARPHALLPLPASSAVPSPVAALCFTAASDKLLVVSEEKSAHLFDLESGARGWAREPHMGPQLSERLRLLPGHVTAVSTDPARGLGAVLIHTPLALCHVDLCRPLGGGGEAPAGAEAPQKRRRVREGGVPPHSLPGSNGRIIPLEHPALFAAYFAKGAALLIELPQEELTRALPPALARPRFGG